MSKQLPLFATENDMSLLVQEVGNVRPIDLAVMGLFDQSESHALVDPMQIKQLTSYLAFEKGLVVVSRPVQQRNGGIKFAIDPMANPWSIALRCGGQLDAGRLTAGDISVATENPHAKELFAIFSRIVRSQFQKIQSYYVGAEAVRILDQGGRLTPTAKSPPNYDLTR
jgi:hypothetical protein